MPQQVLVVDDDAIVCKQMVAYLADAGVPMVDFAHDGTEAWTKIQAITYDAFVVDWKLPGVSGLALFNRIRRMRKYAMTPVLVVSGLLKREDFRMLQEFPCTALVEKPFARSLLLKNISDLCKEESWYHENQEMAFGLEQELVSNTEKTLATIRKNALAGAPSPLPLVVTVARKLRESGSLALATRILKQVLEIEPRHIQAMNEIGKVLHLLGRHREALNFLKEANILAPQNINRLCLMGEAELNLCNPDSAKSYFTLAVGVDDQDLKAHRGVSVANDLAEAISQPTNDHIPRTFASLLNVVGISLVRSGNFAKGIGKYRNALRFLHQNDKSARVAFNLGLGYLRWGKPQEALEWFQKSKNLGAETFAKSQQYVIKLKAALAEAKKGTDVAVVARDLAKNAGEEFVEESLSAPVEAETTGSSAPTTETMDEEPEIQSESAGEIAA